MRITDKKYEEVDCLIKGGYFENALGQLLDLIYEQKAQITKLKHQLDDLKHGSNE